jgi:carbonic anhydrase
MNEDWVLCAEDLNQSPIDLTGAEEFHLPPIEIVMPEGQEAEVLNQGSVADALDNGHTIQINVPHGTRDPSPMLSIMVIRSRSTYRMGRR